MNRAFHAVIAASDAERRDLFLAAAARLGTAVQNVEKDFWVCWMLNGKRDRPRHKECGDLTGTALAIRPIVPVLERELYLRFMGGPVGITAVVLISK